MHSVFIDRREDLWSSKQNGFEHALIDQWFACRWEDPKDLAGKARSYIDVNWGAAYRLHHAPHGQ